MDSVRKHRGGDAGADPSTNNPNFDVASSCNNKSEYPVHQQAASPGIYSRAREQTSRDEAGLCGYRDRGSNMGGCQGARASAPGADETHASWEETRANAGSSQGFTLPGDPVQSFRMTSIVPRPFFEQPTCQAMHLPGLAVPQLPLHFCSHAGAKTRLPAHFPTNTTNALLSTTSYESYEKKDGRTADKNRKGRERSLRTRLRNAEKVRILGENIRHLENENTRLMRFLENTETESGGAISKVLSSCLREFENLVSERQSAGLKNCVAFLKQLESRGRDQERTEIFSFPVLSMPLETVPHPSCGSLALPCGADGLSISTPPLLPDRNGVADDIELSWISPGHIQH
jgi:hypothetical protein